MNIAKYFESSKTEYASLLLLHIATLTIPFFYFLIKDGDPIIFALAYIIIGTPIILYSAKKALSDVSSQKKDFEEKISAINESSIIAAICRKQKIIEINENFKKKTSSSRSGTIGEKFYDVFLSKEDSSQDVWGPMMMGRCDRRNFYIVGEDKSETWMDCFFFPVMMNGRLKKVIVIAHDITEEYKQKVAIMKKNKYLEHSAKILRHDMNSGINIYIPRGVVALERKLPADEIKKYRLGTSIKLIKEGLAQTQSVYNGVKAFSNLVREGVDLEVEKFDLEYALQDYFSMTAYKDQVVIESLPKIVGNRYLMCTAIDNLVKNGIKYNDSKTKRVDIYMENRKTLCVRDNGRGMSQEDFVMLSEPYCRKDGQVETGSGLGLNITVAIVEEHGFNISAERLEKGTIIRIGLKL